MSEKYEEILGRMQETFEEQAGYSADDASDIGIRLKVLAGEIYSCCTNIDWLRKQVFPQTATGQQLDYHAQQRGIQRKAAVKSQGTLTFSRATALLYSVIIPGGTICSTQGIPEIRFVTTQDAVLPAGSLQVSVSAQSDEGGRDSNVAANTVKVMITPPSGITAVNNGGAFVGGSNAETDDELRERILESYRNIPNGTNCAFYIDQALKYESVYTANAIPRARGNGSVDVYVAGRSSALPASLLALIQSDFDGLKEINVNVRVSSPVFVNGDLYMEISVKEGYDFNAVKANCEVSLRNYIKDLKIGESLLRIHAGEVVYHIEGVKNFRFNTYADIKADADELIIPRNISISEED